MLITSFAASALLLAGCSSNPEVASTEAGRIRQDDFYEAMKNEPLQGGMTVGETVLQRILLEDVFDYLYGDQVSDEDVDAELEASAEQFGGVEEYETVLEAQGMDIDFVRDNIYMSLLINEAVTDNVEITDEEVEEAYEAQTPIATVQHILVADEDQANDIIAQLDDGADFAELVTEYSQDPGSVDNEGKYTITAGQMVPEFEEASLNLEEGETTSEPVQTDNGYHVIRRLELESDYGTLDEERENIEAMLAESYMQDQEFMANLISDLAKEANVQIADDDLVGAMSAYMPEEETEEDSEGEETPEDSETEGEEDTSNEEGTEE